MGKTITVQINFFGPYLKKEDIPKILEQKPVELYEWILKMFAKKGDKILDTHLGSGTIAIACHNAGFDLTACEIDKNYYRKSLTKIREKIPNIILD